MNKKILNCIKNEIKKNKKNLEKIFEIDKKYNKNDFDIDKYLELINLYNFEKDYIFEKDKSMGIIYFGNIEFTISISIFAIMNNLKLTLFIQDYFVGINRSIVSIINKCLKENKIKNEIQIFNMYSWQEIANLSNNFNKLICFGDTNSYIILKSMDVKNLFNYKYGLDIFVDNKEFDGISHKIVNLSYILGIEVQVYDDIEELLQKENNYCILILSNDFNKYKYHLNNKLTSKYIINNENPFNKLKIDYKLIQEVLGLV